MTLKPPSVRLLPMTIFALASLLVLGTPLSAFTPELSSYWQAGAYLAGALGLFVLGLVELARPRSPA